MLYNKKKYLALIFMIPLIVFTVAFLFYPAILNIYNSFFRFKNRLDSNPEFVGIWHNISWLGRQPQFWWSLRNTFILVAMVIVFQVGIALVLALLVNNIKKMANLYRVLFFMPIVISAAAIGTMYLMMISPEGVFTKLIGKDTYSWLPPDSPRAFITVCLPVIWQYIGFYFVIMLTGLTNISDDIMEAGNLDGASAMQLIWYVTLPMLWNVFRTCMVLAITGALKVFDMPHIIARDGAPAMQTIFMGTYNNFLNGRGNLGGQVSIYSILIVLLGMAVSMISNAVLRENKDI